MTFMIGIDLLISKFCKKPDLETLIRINNIIDDSIYESIGSFVIDNNCNTLLHVRQNKETMEYLLDKGGDPNIENLDLITPVLIQRDYDVIRLLERRGANLNHKDSYNFGIFHWQKDAKITEYLIKKEIDIHSYNIIYEPKTESIYSDRNKMLIDGGYDPYNEKYISIPGYFLQRDIETIVVYLASRYCYFPQYLNSCDLFCESILFKAFLTKKEMALYLTGGEDVNFTNLFGNTPLYVHHDEDIIEELILMGANIEHQNTLKETPTSHHLIKNNIGAYTKINNHLSAKIIQRSWKRWLFKKNLVPFKNYLLKKEFLQEIYYSPPICENKYFKGGLGYQEVLEEFTHLSSLQETFQ